MRKPPQHLYSDTTPTLLLCSNCNPLHKVRVVSFATPNDEINVWDEKPVKVVVNGVQLGEWTRWSNSYKNTEKTRRKRSLMASACGSRVIAQRHRLKAASRQTDKNKRIAITVTECEPSLSHLCLTSIVHRVRLFLSRLRALRAPTSSHPYHLRFLRMCWALKFWRLKDVLFRSAWLRAHGRVIGTRAPASVWPCRLLPDPRRRR